MDHEGDVATITVSTGALVWLCRVGLGEDLKPTRQGSGRTAEERVEGRHVSPRTPVPSSQHAGSQATLDHAEEFVLRCSGVLVL